MTKPAAPQVSDTPVTVMRGGTETILLVEDESSVRSISRLVLENYGYKVLEAGSAPEALSIWNTHSKEIALLVTDMVMPQGVTGRALAEQLQGKQPALQVLFLSGYSPEMTTSDTTFIHRHQANFLQKPCSAPTLIQAVRRCLDEHPRS